MANIKQTALDRYVIRYEAIEDDPVTNIRRRIKRRRLRPEDIVIPR